MADNHSFKQFLFGRSFDDGADPLPVLEKEVPQPIYTQDQMDLAIQDAFTQGRQMGVKNTQEGMLDKQNLLIKVLAGKIDQLVGTTDQREKNATNAIQEIGVTIARKILPEYCAKYGLDEIKSLITNAIKEMSREPRLVIRVSEGNFEVIDSKLKAITDKLAYSGQIVILSDEEMSSTDCRIEWADGGIELNNANIWREVDRALLRANTPHAAASATSEALAAAVPAPPNATDVAI